MSKSSAFFILSTFIKRTDFIYRFQERLYQMSYAYFLTLKVSWSTDRFLSSYLALHLHWCHLSFLYCPKNGHISRIWRGFLPRTKATEKNVFQVVYPQQTIQRRPLKFCKAGRNREFCWACTPEQRKRRNDRKYLSFMNLDLVCFCILNDFAVVVSLFR